jgi:NADH-quinone oxidoreductase subunit C
VSLDAFGSIALQRLIKERSSALLSTHASHGDATACVSAAEIVSVLEFLRDDAACTFEMLSDLCAVDYLEMPDDSGARFEVVYHLYSISKNHRVRVKARVPAEPCEIASVVGLWPAANWMEREVWDLYGVRFIGHPDLRRLLLYEEFEGHPLRKDYPKRRRQPLIGPRN